MFPPSQILGVPVGHHIYLRALVGGRLVVRPYTPVSPKKQEGSFDLVVKIYTQGQSPLNPAGGYMSQYLDQLNIGDAVEVIERYCEATNGPAIMDARKRVE